MEVSPDDDWASLPGTLLIPKTIPSPLDTTTVIVLRPQR